MKHRMISRAAAASLFAATALVCIGSAPTKAQGAIDGTYAVTLITDAGACDAKFSWTVAVSAGTIQSSGPFLRAKGDVSPSGDVEISVTRGADTLVASGRLSGESGKGAWRSASRDCSGSWRAEKT